MTDPTITIIAIIRANLSHLRARPEITAETLLDDIGVDQVARDGIGIDVEMSFDREFADATVEGWRSVADIVASVAVQEVGA